MALSVCLFFRYHNDAARCLNSRAFAHRPFAFPFWKLFLKIHLCMCLYQTKHLKRLFNLGSINFTKCKYIHQISCLLSFIVDAWTFLYRDCCNSAVGLFIKKNLFSLTLDHTSNNYITMTALSIHRLESGSQYKSKW